MTSTLIVLIIIASIVLSFFVLIQKPKGGGLSGTFGSIGTQVMGVKQSGDVMEKGTWYAVGVVALLSVAVVFTLNVQKPQAPAANEEKPQTEQNAPAGNTQQQPAQQPAQ